MSNRINPYKMFNGSFIPEAVSRVPIKELSHGAKLAYGRLIRYSGKDGLCNPKQATLAKEIGVSTVQVTRLVKELVDFGLIESIRNGIGRSNHYCFLNHIVFEGREQSNVTVPSILRESDKESQLRVTEVITSEQANELPSALGKNRLLRLLKVYQKLWEAQFNSPYQPNYARFGKTLKGLEDLSEQQVATLLVVHFNWRGMLGEDDFTHKRYVNAGFPLEWAVTSRNEYMAYLKAQGIDFNNNENLTGWLAKELSTV
jgi:hypothetical protein